jgi:hypothetical protein
MVNGLALSSENIRETEVLESYVLKRMSFLTWLILLINVWQVSGSDVSPLTGLSWLRFDLEIICHFYVYFVSWRYVTRVHFTQHYWMNEGTKISVPEPVVKVR